MWPFNKIFKKKIEEPKEDVKRVSNQDILDKVESIDLKLNKLDKLDEIDNKMAKEETLISVSNKVDQLRPELEVINNAINSLKMTQLPGLDQKIIEKTKQQLYLQRNRIYQEELIKAIRDMVLSHEQPFFNNIVNKVSNIMSRPTVWKNLKKLVAKGDIVKRDFERFTLFLPFDMLSEEQKQMLKKSV